MKKQDSLRAVFLLLCSAIATSAYGDEAVVPLYSLTGVVNSADEFKDIAEPESLKLSVRHTKSLEAKDIVIGIATAAIFVALAPPERPIPRVDDLRVIPSLEQLKNQKFEHNIVE